MRASEIAEAIQSSLREKFPEIKLAGDDMDRESFSIDFAIDQDSGSILIELEPEELTCLACSGMVTDSSNLMPVTDGEVFGVACIHQVDSLRNWRRLTEEELVEFNKASDALIDLLWGLGESKRLKGQ